MPGSDQLRPPRKRLKTNEGKAVPGPTFEGKARKKGVLSLKVAKCKVQAYMECRWKPDTTDKTHKLCQVLEIRQSCGEYEYYCHFIGLNRRMDDWVKGSQLRKPTGSAKEELEKLKTGGRVTRGRMRKYNDRNHGEEEHLDPEQKALEKEHEENTKVKNISRIHMGEFQVDTWYFSPYPEEYQKCEKLFVCEYCLKYCKRASTYIHHRKTCRFRHPPGSEVYRHKGVSIFEVDGEKEKIYCQNLCLLSKLFLDHKTLYFDVAPFWFYIVCEYDDHGFHIVGYFSKEKNSPENYNLACILVLPQHQRKGYGKFLISLSYELSRKEKKVGSPEKPLSDLGKISYRSFWTEHLLRFLDDHRGQPLTVEDVSKVTAFLPDDVAATLQDLNMLQFWKGTRMITAHAKVLDAHLEAFKTRQEKYKDSPRVKFEGEFLEWEPRTRKSSRLQQRRKKGR